MSLQSKKGQVRIIHTLKGHLFYPLVEKASGRQISEKFQSAKNFSILPSQKRRAQIESYLEAILSEAKLNVPYYKDLFHQIHFDPREVRGNINALKQLPFLTKDIVREQGDRLLNRRYELSSLVKMNTGGSTGACLTISYDREALDWSAAANRFAVSMTGASFSTSEVHLVSRISQKNAYKQKLTNWVKCQALNRTNFETDFITESSLENLYNTILRTKPFLVQGHPSTLYALATYVRDCKPTKKLFSVFESTGETLDKKRFQVIKDQLQCTIFNRYGNAEFGVIAHSIDNPFQLQLLDFMVLPEMVQLGNGLCELIFTGLHNRAMPLIRYRSGDIGNLTVENNRVHIADLRGRIHDLMEFERVHLPSHYLLDVFNHRGDVDDFQIVVRSGQKPELRIVKKTDTPSEKIKSELANILSNQVEIKFVRSDQFILSGWRDKFRYIVRAD